MNARLIKKIYPPSIQNIHSIRESTLSRWCRRLSSRLVALTLAMLLINPVTGQAATIILDAMDVQSGRDNGPKDGIFDAFVNPGTPSLVDNGFTEFRMGAEFDLSLVSNSITSATLSFVANDTNTSAQIAIYGFEGDGLVSLLDIGFTGNLLGSSSGQIGVNSLDVTGFITNELVGNFAGFSFDEALRQPSPTTNRFSSFQLTLETTDANVVEPGMLPLMITGVLIGVLLHRKRIKKITS